MKTPNELSGILLEANESLAKCTDKDWNYSRIRLCQRPLAEITSPYVLWIEVIGRDSEFKQLQAEVAWGSRHSDELGILEIVSLRLNKALMQASSNTQTEKHPVIRIVKKQELESQQIAEAFWYEIQEVCGEDFDTR